MKKTFIVLAAVFFAACSKNGSNNPSNPDDEPTVIPIVVPIEGYTNLGLPSGTQWKESNESGLFEYYKALELFQNQMPTSKQFEELKEKCTWVWNGNGYTVTGPNGNSINLPAAGRLSINNLLNTKEIIDNGVRGYYWPSDHTDGNNGYYSGYYLSFGETYIGSIISAPATANGFSVRLCTEPIAITIVDNN